MFGIFFSVPLSTPLCLDDQRWTTHKNVDRNNIFVQTTQLLHEKIIQLELYALVASHAKLNRALWTPP